MKTHSFPLLLFTLTLGACPGAQAHFPILIHDADLTATSGPVTVIYATGHPFELDLEPAPKPDRLIYLDGRGQTTNLTSALAATLFRGDTNGGAWQLRFEPARGDGLLALDSAASVDAAHKTVYREHVKVYLHRGRQESWHQRTGQPLEIVPLTRPYGLRTGMVFTGKLMRGDAPVTNTEIYFERLNERRPTPDSLPPEPLITFAVRTDGHGQFTVALPDAGWWILGAYVDDLGKVRHDEKDHRLEGFAGIWLRIDSK